MTRAREMRVDTRCLPGADVRAVSHSCNVFVFLLYLRPLNPSADFVLCTLTQAARYMIQGKSVTHIYQMGAAATAVEHGLLAATGFFYRSIDKSRFLVAEGA